MRLIHRDIKQLIIRILQHHHFALDPVRLQNTNTTEYADPICQMHRIIPLVQVGNHSGGIQLKLAARRHSRHRTGTGPDLSLKIGGKQLLFI